MSIIDERIDSFYESYNAHDAARAAALYRAGGSHSDHALAKVSRGAAEIEQGLVRFFAMIPDIRFSEKKRIVAANRAVVLYEMSGNLHHKSKNGEESVSPVDLSGVHCFFVEDEKLSSTEDYWDMAEFKQQIKT